MKKAVRTATLGCRHCLPKERLVGSYPIGRKQKDSAVQTAMIGCRHCRLERVTGIEPAASAWEAEVLPLDYTREQLYCTLFARICQELFGNYPPKSKIIFSACRKRRKIRSSLSKERERSDFSVASISSATRGRWRIPRRWFERISESARQRSASFSPRPIRRR